jgi:zinc D-Ala-D-Ala carboxypeptidase
MQYIKYGSQGDAVRDVQILVSFALAPLGVLVVDGIFGPKTLATVKQFRSSVHLNTDGIVGPRTLSALFTVLGKRGKAGLSLFTPK